MRTAHVGAPGRRIGLRVPAALALATLVLVGCSCCEEPGYWGNVFVDNLTHSTTLEDILDFRVAAFGQPWTGNLLGPPLPPAATRFVGTFSESYYDADAQLSGGDLVEWFDIFVGQELDVFFEVF
jgi:hypothetical protein